MRQNRNLIVKREELFEQLSKGDVYSSGLVIL